MYADGEVLAIVTIVTERYRTQYALLYTTRMQEAVTDKEIECSERNAYNNPAVSLSTADMTKYARQIWSSSAKYRNVATKMHRMVMRLNNILQRGRIFLHRLLRGEQDQHPLRHRRDAHQTIGQEAEQGYQCADSGTDPISCVGHAKTFKYGYRNVIVVKKMTFPNDKVLTIELVGKTDKWTHHLAQHRL